MGNVTTYFEPRERPYSRLAGHFAFREFGIAGDAIVAFVGPCDVRGDDLVDLADRRAGDYIAAARMLHFIVEHFGVGLPEIVWRQRLLVVLALEELRARRTDVPFRRAGDDIFVGDDKLSVSVATVAPTSALIHLGLNVDKTGAPVAAADLTAWGIDAPELAAVIMARYAAEVDDVARAVVKVRAVC